ncbi:universal stress protein A-like protein [Tripterygium wilfordii]|uniref:Universal stress protein A-like protein n=1 Tax=Tripterygium wilfordii TaxID=458696 RepID=A0A7J7E020_TRIWF|nr:universal stress protein A-like protein [Tripterygium wilfordii]KAF5751917.1 universal stress protein A-like protein [Tripterygium wilfordii]
MAESEEKKRKVMLSIDESECSHYSVEWALDNLRDTLSNSHLVIYTVQSFADYAYIYASTHGVAAPELIRSIQENKKRDSQALLEKAKDICSKHGIPVETTIMEVGDPKDEICKAVEKLDIQLLILGSHGRGAIQRAFLGSVSNYCVHNAKCPVLVVRKQD